MYRLGGMLSGESFNQAETEDRSYDPVLGGVRGLSQFVNPYGLVDSALRGVQHPGEAASSTLKQGFDALSPSSGLTPEERGEILAPDTATVLGLGGLVRQITPRGNPAVDAGLATSPAEPEIPKTPLSRAAANNATEYAPYPEGYFQEESEKPAAAPAPRSRLSTNRGSGWVSDRLEDPHAGITEVVNAAQPNGPQKRVALSVISEPLARKIKQDTGVETLGYAFVMDSDHVWHTIRKHGDPKTEAALGQIALTRADFHNVLPAVTAPDSVMRTQTDHGAPALLFTKTMNGEHYVVTAVHDGAKRLSFVTYYKKPLGGKYGGRPPSTP